MQDYRVELDTFSGPLDLLLFLVKRDEIDLFDIPVGRLTEQYLEYLGRLESIDVDVAGEFLVMAAALLELKSAMLVPSPAADGEDPGATPADQAIDPRMDLVRQLLAYKRFKDLARMLEERMEDWSRRWPRRPMLPRDKSASDADATLLEQAACRDNAPPADDLAADADTDQADTVAGQREFDLDDANVLDLAEAFARVMETIGRGPGRHEVLYDDTPIGLHAEDILDRLGREGGLTLQQVFTGRPRGERVGLFLALLELVRQRKVRVAQDDMASPIQIDLLPPEQAGRAASAQDSSTGQPSPWIDPDTGQVQYDWPSEEARRAAERRQRLRDKWAQRRAGQSDPVDGADGDAPVSEAREDDDAPPDELSDSSHTVDDDPLPPVPPTADPLGDERV